MQTHVVQHDLNKERVLGFKSNTPLPVLLLILHLLLMPLQRHLLVLMLNVASSPDCFPKRLPKVCPVPERTLLIVSPSLTSILFPARPPSIRPPEKPKSTFSYETLSLKLTPLAYIE